MAHYHVTGASGFCGGVLKRRVLRKRHSVQRGTPALDELSGRSKLTASLPGPDPKTIAPLIMNLSTIRNLISPKNDHDS
jgi:hypothetical protein